jgi:hypothetical protein
MAASAHRLRQIAGVKTLARIAFAARLPRDQVATLGAAVAPDHPADDVYWRLRDIGGALAAAAQSASAAARNAAALDAHRWTVALLDGGAPARQAPHETATAGAR